jgi:WD40 repeat protein
MSSYLEDNVGEILGPRGGRLEYDNGWKPEVDPYEAVPFTHETVQCGAVSADGKMLVTGGADCSVKVWSLLTGELLYGFTHSIAYDDSNDYRRVSVIGNSHNDDEGVGVLKPKRAGVTFVAFSHEKPAQFIVSAVHDPKHEPSIKLWSLKSPWSMPKIMVGGHSVGTVIHRCEFLPPENRRLVTIGSDFNVALWEVARCKIIRVIPMNEADEDVVAEAQVSKGGNGGSSRRPSSAHSLKRTRLHPSGWSKVSGGVAPNGLFAFGSGHLTVMDSRWKEILIRDLNGPLEKEKLKRHRLTAAVFSTDSTIIYAASAVPPDDAQMMLVEMQLKTEKLTAKNDQVIEGLGGDLNSSSMERAASTASLSLNAAAVEAEMELKKARQSVIRAWNIQTGQLLMAFLVEDYIHSLCLSPDSQYLLTVGSKGIVTGWNPNTGLREFARESHAGSILQVAPVVNIKSIKSTRKSVIGTPTAAVSAQFDDDDTGSFSYESGYQIAVSRSQVSMNSSTRIPLRFVTVGTNNIIFAWSLDGDKPEPGFTPVVSSDISQNGEWLVTVGGSLTGASPRPNSMVRVWESSTAMNRVKIELPETSRTDILTAQFIAGDDQKLLVGCRNGLVRLYKSRTGEMYREFWTDVETALSESTLGYKSEWPFAVSGTIILGYALHPEGKILAVAVIGQERLPKPASTLQNLKNAYVTEAATAASISRTQQEYKDFLKVSDAVPSLHSRKNSAALATDRVADMVLQDAIKLTFWDIEAGSPLSLDASFQYPIFFSASEYTSVPGPFITRPSLERRNEFVLKWSQDGKTLYASDDIEILRECTIEFRGNKVFGTCQTPKWMKNHAPPKIRNFELGTNLHLYRYNIPAPTDVAAPLPGAGLSGATACKCIIYKDTDYLCFAYGDGIIGLRRKLVKRGWEDIEFYTAHRNIASLGGEIIGVEYVPQAMGRGGYDMPPKHDDVTGVIVSASKNGTVIIQVSFTLASESDMNFTNRPVLFRIAFQRKSAHCLMLGVWSNPCRCTCRMGRIHP